VRSGAGAGDSVRQGHGARVAPEGLEAVELAFVAEEDVGDHAAVVDDDPLADRMAVLVEGRAAELFPGRLADAGPDRLELRFRRGGADDEEIRESRDFAEVQDMDVLGFLSAAARAQQRASSSSSVVIEIEAPLGDDFACCFRQ